MTEFDALFKAYEDTAYFKWMKDEGIPVLKSYGIEDVRELELFAWKRTGGKGTFVSLYGMEGTTGMYVMEIPPGGALEPENRSEDVETEVAEELVEESPPNPEVAHALEDAAEIGAPEDVLLGVSLVDAGVAVLVVEGALLRVGEHGVRLGDFLELVLGFLLLLGGHAVGVRFQGELPVGLLQLLRSGALADTRGSRSSHVWSTCLLPAQRLWGSPRSCFRNASMALADHAFRWLAAFRTSMADAISSLRRTTSASMTSSSVLLPGRAAGRGPGLPGAALGPPCGPPPCLPACLFRLPRRACARPWSAPPCPS